MKNKFYSKNLISIAAICLFTLGLFTSQKSNSQDINTGLMMYYNFEGFTGTTVPDASANSNNGTIMGAAQLKTGFSGLGIQCPLSQDYIRLPENITAELKSFTFATWAYFTSVNNSTRFFDFGNIAGDNNPDDFLCFMPNNGSGFARMRYRTTGGAVGINCDATVATPANQWAHIAITFSWDEPSATGTAIIYLNGVNVGTSAYSNFNPSLLGGGVTANNFIAHSRWAQDGTGLNANLDEIRLYNRALTESDMSALFATSSRSLMLQNGYSEALMSAQETLAIPGDLTSVTAPLALPTSAPGDVSIIWKSSNSLVVDSLGNIFRPAQYDATIKLTATLIQIIGEKTFILTKDFTVTVKAFNEAGFQLAKWTFGSENIIVENGAIKVKDESESNFVATLVNEASIRTIGETEKFNVLALGSGTGYMDMGTDIGKAIYSLNNYTMCAFFRVDEDYTNLDANGNFIWTFSNTEDAMNDPTGYIIGSLKATSQSIAIGRYNIGNQAIGANVNVGIGAWHHFAYTQKDDIGTIYVDGIEVVTGNISNTPSLALVRAGREGTLYNWLGRSNYTSDAYLQKTLLYDFQLWRDAMSPDDLNIEMNVSEVINKLNNAYNENPNALLPELGVEKEALTINNLDAITGNLTLPSTGIIDPGISITWKSNFSDIIKPNGEVSRPDFYPLDVILTANMIKNGQSVTKDFPARVIEKAGTAFTGNLLVKFDFSNVTDTIVVDVAEQKLEGALVNGATVRTIGEIVKYNTLDLSDSTGYFDMGKKMGRILYNLSDHTISCYYRIDSSYTKIANNGNFLWTFSNSNNTGDDRNGCLFGGLKSQTMAITPTYWDDGEQVISAGLAASIGGWHHMAYTQKDTIGTLYIDGMPVLSDTITWLPSNTLVKPNRIGTNYNWLGRSCYSGDAYLTKTLVHDFRIYNKALNEEEIQVTELNVGAKINALEAAYAENPNIPTSIKSSEKSSIKVYSTSNGINISGLKGFEKVSVFDITGRQIKIFNPSDITISKGLYFVKVDNFVTKVFVR